jgi:hypothetical protein
VRDSGAATEFGQLRLDGGEGKVVRLVIVRDETPVGEIVLERGTLTIGRGGDNDIQFENRAVSSRHAKLVTLFDSSYIEDLDSTNGTFVNGVRVQSRALQDGDVIGIGHNSLVFAQDSDRGSETIGQGISSTRSQRSAVTFRRWDFKGSAPRDSGTDSRLEPPIPGADEKRFELETGAQECRACLRILSGAKAGRRFLLTKSVTTLRNGGVKVAEIRETGGGHLLLCVADRASAGLVRLNRQSIGAEIRPLSVGDEIDAGGIRLEYSRPSED